MLDQVADAIENVKAPTTTNSARCVSLELMTAVHEELWVYDVQGTRKIELNWDNLTASWRKNVTAAFIQACITLPKSLHGVPH